MALKRTRATGPAAASASPSRELAAFTPRTALGTSVLGTGLLFAGARLAPELLQTAAAAPTAIGAAAAVAAAGVIGGKVRGRTVGQWISLRRSVDDLPEQAALFSRDGVGIVFDGHTVTALVEIMPRPWQVTTVGPTGASEAPVISADVLRRQLHQFDISLSRIDVICAGYKFAARDNASSVLDALIGAVSVPLGATTVLAVSLDLKADMLVPAYRRARRSSLPDGLCQALTLAATRVRNSLAEQGFGGRLMSAPRVREFHDRILSQVARPMAEPHWRNCGPTSGVHTRTYVPARGHWNSASAGSWNHLQAHRQYTTLTLTPQGAGQALAQPLITYLVRGADALSKAESYGLRTATGEQVSGLTRTLPVSAQLPLRSAGAIVDDNHQLGFGIPAGGAGMFVGMKADKTRVFVAVSPAEEPLWLSGPALFALQMVARLATQDHRIAVMVDEPHWRHLVDHHEGPALSLGTVDSAPADVVVCTPQWWERNRALTAGKAVLLVTEDAPGSGASNTLTVKTTGTQSEVVVHTDATSINVLWELTPMERRGLLGDVDTSGAASPREGVDLRLGDVVSVPNTDPAPKPAPQRAPAPAVATPGQFSGKNAKQREPVLSPRQQRRREHPDRVPAMPAPGAKPESPPVVLPQSGAPAKPRPKAEPKPKPKPVVPASGDSGLRPLPQAASAPDPQPRGPAPAKAAQSKPAPRVDTLEQIQPPPADPPTQELPPMKRAPAEDTPISRRGRHRNPNEGW